MKIKNDIIEKRKELEKKIMPFWKEFEMTRDDYYKKVNEIEKRMKKACNDKDIEFACVEGEYFGIGFGSFNKKNQTIGLFHFD